MDKICEGLCSNGKVEVTRFSAKCTITKRVFRGIVFNAEKITILLCSKCPKRFK